LITEMTGLERGLVTSRQLVEIGGGFVSREIATDGSRKLTTAGGEEVTFNANGKLVAATALFDAIYPIGSIYESTVSTSPATLFGGTWEQIKDRFVLAAGDTYTAGDTGGAATVTLTTSQMPSHSHTITTVKNSSMPTYYTDLAGGFTSNNTGTGTTTSSLTGNGNAHNNMPPYLVVYMWKRTD
jgi:hypothetical protein